MSGVAAFLMVASGAMCLTGAIVAKSRLGAAASSLMLMAMVDLVYTAVLPPVAWSGTLLVIGMILAASLRPAPAPVQQRAPVPVGARAVPKGLSSSMKTVESALRELSTDRPWTAPGPATSDAPGSSCPRLHFFPRLGRTAAICSAIAYPIMAWQVLNHGTPGGSHHTAAAGSHGGHGHAVDPSAIHTVISGGVIVLAVLLVLCAVQAISRRRLALFLECLGMAAMINVMQFLP
ncbi:hypothetical protein [Brevibacterium renqingii]|uniref:hypothetical protein n=1 Tax=Brevibacterium renqingii TaxID=2776916 RepID=UPI001ADF9D70|nr:hypothetical protein [Brevibacterium renqingii]